MPKKFYSEKKRRRRDTERNEEGVDWKLRLDKEFKGGREGGLYRNGEGDERCERRGVS
jgi:hypothetical protein